MKKISLFLSLFSMHIMASDLIIEQRTGARLVYDINIIGKWVYIGSDLQLIDKNGNILATEPVLDIKKIVFVSANSTIDPDSTNSIIVYPNPTQDMLMIQGIKPTLLRVYDMNGKVVQQEYGTEIHVGSLCNGVYLIQIETQVARFIKK